MQYDCPGRSNPSWLSLMLSTEFQSTLNVQYFITVARPLGILWFKQLKELCIMYMVFTDFNCFENLWDLPDPGMEAVSLASLTLAGKFFTTVPPGKPPYHS